MQFLDEIFVLIFTHIASSNNETQSTIISVIPLNPISILLYPSPIKLRTITTGSNEANFAGFETVYDSLDNSNATLPVHILVLGLLDGNNTLILPPGFQSIFQILHLF